MKPGLLALVLLAVPAQAETLRLGTEGAYPPYTFLDDEGTLRGFDIDLGNEICIRLERDCDWVVREWEALIPGLLAREFDAILAAMSATPERARVIDFTRPYEFPPAPSIYVGQFAFPDLDTSVIAVQSGTIHEDHLRELGRTFKGYATAQAAFDAMMNGEADLVFGTQSFLEPKVFRTSRTVQIVASEQLAAGASSVAVRKGDPLRARIDGVLDAMWADGSLAKLVDRWFPETSDT